LLHGLQFPAQWAEINLHYAVLWPVVINAHADDHGVRNDIDYAQQ
jgi:hypothetical protein